MAKSPQRIEQLESPLGEQRRPHPFNGKSHPAQEFPTVPGRLFDRVFEEIGDRLEETLKSTI
jgi:hypothetical protein